MHAVKHQLVHTPHVTMVLVITPTERVLHDYRVAWVTRHGRQQATYIDAETGVEIFSHCYFDLAEDFEYGYAVVQKNGRTYHINTKGRAAYRWRFSDVGPLDETGTVLVQHPRARGWSRFHMPSGMFVTNPPRYRR